MITCCRCGIQYVGEIVESLIQRFSGHMTGMKIQFAENKCDILNKHFCVGYCRNASYIVNIIEKLSGFGRDDNGIPILGITAEKQKKETNKVLPLHRLNKRED